jgi:RNA polymerase sigma-70 factor (ECF subfamily)
VPAEAPTQDGLYREAADTYGAGLERLARAYEADPEVRRDLLQDIHIALWRSLAGFNGCCSFRTWVYRVAHNVATSHVIRQRRAKSRTLVGLEELESLPDKSAGVPAADRRHVLERRTRATCAISLYPSVCSTSLRRLSSFSYGG